MSAYANDPRVFGMGYGSYIVELADSGRVDIEPRRSGPGFLQYPRDGVTVDQPLRIFSTADEAIGNLIGDPR